MRLALQARKGAAPDCAHQAVPAAGGGNGPPGPRVLVTRAVTRPYVPDPGVIARPQRLPGAAAPGILPPGTERYRFSCACA